MKALYRPTFILGIIGTPAASQPIPFPTKLFIPITIKV